MKNLLLFLIFSTSIFLLSCNGGKTVSDFDPLSNFHENQLDTIYHLETDLSDAVLNGIEIPTKTQTQSGYFKFKFNLKNTYPESKEFRYKIYFQNENYKLNDSLNQGDENFYGSWSDSSITYKITKSLAKGEEITIIDSFKIVGNPRNEKIYYGADPQKYLSIDQLLKDKIEYVKTVPEWMVNIKKKATKAGLSIDEQIYLDALWAINYEKSNEKKINNRWKRNPRMGTYEFMLVVTTPEDFDKIPNQVKDLQLTDSTGKYKNPFGYFKSSQSKGLVNTIILQSEKKLKISTKMDLGSGIYVDKLNINKSKFSSESFNSQCNTTPELYHKANFQQYFHTINKDYTVYNIPEIKDVTGESITREDYQMYLKKYESTNKRVKMFVSTSDCPCKTVKSDAKKNSITMINPAASKTDYKKEHVGVFSRVGFTYGKFRAKIKFPKMLSKDNVWNGITNAFWLLFQSESDWNKRRDCNAEIAYIPKAEPNGDESLKRSVKSTYYSEIDFEIIKESQYWPKTSYFKNNSNATYKTDDAANNNDIMVTCTNWDMACHEPKKFSIGANEFKYENYNYLLHRWDHSYKALSSKVPVNHNEMFDAPYYYFEIEWLPEKIIWKIGPEKNKLKTICVMDEDATAVPNNQMIILFTQEWHNEEWWPTAPYKQNFVPFPKKDLIGEILEITIE